MSPSEWRRLAWLALGTGFLVGVSLTIILFNTTAHFE